MKVTMLGPGLEVRGGMTAVVQTWMASAALNDVHITFVPTMGEGSRAKKVAKMARGQAVFLKSLNSLPDLFHVHVTAQRSTVRKLWYVEQAVRTGRPIVVHVHNDFSVFYQASRANARLVRRLLGQATLVIALNRHAQAQLESWTGGQVRVEVLHNPVSLGRFQTADVLQQPPTVLYMGVIGSRKGAFELVEVIPEVQQAVPGVRFFLGGDGEVDRLRRHVNQLGLVDSVEVPGWVSGPAKAAAFEQAGLYCLPSHREGLPVSVLEAMAAGLPVVSTKLPGTQEAVLDNITGLLGEPGDQPALAQNLIKLAADPLLRQQMGEAGRAHCEANFDVEQVVVRLKELWAQALGSQVDFG